MASSISIIVWYINNNNIYYVGGWDCRGALREKWGRKDQPDPLSLRKPTFTQLASLANHIYHKQGTGQQ